MGKIAELLHALQSYFVVNRSHYLGYSGISKDILMTQSNVKSIMQNNHITYAMLEAKTGLSSHTIARARSSRIRELSLDTLEIIAKALDVRIKDLFKE